jgi:ABC-type sugar transport system permease subunit
VQDNFGTGALLGVLLFVIIGGISALQVRVFRSKV